MEHPKFLNAIMDDACQEYETSASMPNDQTFLESLVTTAYEWVGGAGPSREFEEPQIIQTKHFEQPSVDLPSNPTMGISSCTATPKVKKCPDMAPMDLVPESVLGSQTHDTMTSPLGLEPANIDGHRVTSRRYR
eukprot:Gb_25053 [translate_table: standard]